MTPPVQIPDPAPELRLYLLCGLPFAGKSTLGRTLANRLGLAFLEVDAINRERGLGGDGRRLSRAEWTTTYREAFRRLDRELAEGRSVVYDATNFRRRMRDRLREIGASRGARTVVVLVEPSPAVVHARRERNRVAPERSDVDDADFAEVVDGFQTPMADEDVLRYDGSVPVEVWIGRTWPEGGG
jgi:predicted kinase